MHLQSTVTRLLSALLLLTLQRVASAQQFSYALHTQAEECSKGAAVLSVGGTMQSDTVSIEWSNGHRNSLTLKNLESGDYSVSIRIRRWDSTLHVTDTTLAFAIAKETCPVAVPKYFSPNDDGYNDFLMITHIDKHPEFELGIYNKWGQKVHGQKKNYVPWDGTWNGLPLPDGAYYIVIFYEADNKEKLFRSDVTILR